MVLEIVTRELAAPLGDLRFPPPVDCVYHPLDYAWDVHRQYLDRYARGRKGVLLVGMNPGPFGMVQTGVPFGEVSIVRDWLGLRGRVVRPRLEHPKRPVQGLECARSEVSGARLWGWARDRFASADTFFSRFFVANYCPLAFLETSGRNRTPDKLPVAERQPLMAACDDALRDTIDAVSPSFVVGIGAYAEARAKQVVAAASSDHGREVTVGRMLHPSPASPAANRGWVEAAERDLAALGIELFG
jgi:single-strand selective monofunctional uracil DNA glycosylase